MLVQKDCLLKTNVYPLFVLYMPSFYYKQNWMSLEKDLESMYAFFLLFLLFKETFIIMIFIKKKAREGTLLSYT